MAQQLMFVEAACFSQIGGKTNIRHQLRRENLGRGPAQHSRPGQAVEHFHRRIPVLNAAREVFRHHARAARFENILVELLEALVFLDLLLKRFVEPCVLQGDAEIARQRAYQFDILTR